MGIKIEFSSDQCSVKECIALAAFLAVMTDRATEEEKREILHDLSSRNSPTMMPPADDSTRRTAIITPEDNPAAGIDTDAALQSAGFGGNAAGGAAVPAATIAPPVPPATPPAPPATASAPAPSGNVQLDKRGLPWDHRIHSGERTQNKDGSWRNKRNLPDGEIERVEAELRAVLAVAGPLNPLVPPPPPGLPLPGNPPNGLVGGMPATPNSAMGFMQLLPKVTGAIKAGTLTQDAVNAALVEFSLPNLPAIHHRPDLVQPFHDRLFGAV